MIRPSQTLTPQQIIQITALRLRNVAHGVEMIDFHREALIAILQGLADDLECALS